jgi:hypothetical protein
MRDPAGVRRGFQPLEHRCLRAAGLLAKGIHQSEVAGRVGVHRHSVSSVGATAGRGRIGRSEESRVRPRQAPPERRGLEEDRLLAEAWAGSIGRTDRTVDGLANGAFDWGRMRRPLPYLAGLAHSAVTRLELPASCRTGSGAGRNRDPAVEPGAPAGIKKTARN